MLESDNTDPTTRTPDSTGAAPAPRKRAPRKSAATASRSAGTESAGSESTGTDAPAAPPRKRAPRKATAGAPAQPETGSADAPAAGSEPAKKAAAKKAAAKKAPAKKAGAKKTAAKKAASDAPDPSDAPAGPDTAADTAPPAKKAARKRTAKSAATDADRADASTAPAMSTAGVLFMPPAADAPERRRPAKKAAKKAVEEPAPGGTADVTDAEDAEDQTAEPEDIREAAIEQASGARRRRRRGRRGRGGGGGGARAADDADDSDDSDTEDEPTDEAGSADAADADGDDETGAAGTRRRRRRRRSGGAGEEDGGPDDPPNTVTHVRETKQNSGGGGGRGGGGGGKSSADANDDGVKGVKGSTRLEAKRQRRRDGRETTRRRPPILTESEFLARREAVDRVMAVRQNGDRTQIAVLEDDILVEHYVTRASATSYVGNVYLGRVQNVLPSMEAAFIDIGKGRNGVLYAGEVNWDAAGLEGKSRAIEQALKSGDAVLVQVTKDPIGHKGARLTSQVSLPGRFLVYVPGGGMTGISRRLPDVERHRLKSILKKILPEDAGVIVRTAAEGASEEDLTRDVERLTKQWEQIEAKRSQTKAAPTLVHGEPDLAIRVVRDVFNEDFARLIVEGEDAWKTVSDYVDGVAPDLAARVSRHTKDTDLFHDLRVDEQLMKALDRKVYLPSGGSLVIDRTEAMTVIDVNTGKFVGAGGNLEQTVTRNNIEAAEEIVRQLRLRDVGGIVVIDFIDMVLESNRDLVMRRLTECLGRDRTKHQVAEVTSLGLVQMTRKRVGEGLLEAFSETCEVCHGRGLILHSEPVDKSGNGSGSEDDDRPQSKQQTKRKRGGRGGGGDQPAAPVEPPATPEQRQAATAAIAAIHRAAALEKAAAEAGSTVDELASETVDAIMRQTESELVAAEVEVDAAPPAEVEPAPEPVTEPDDPPSAAEATDHDAESEPEPSTSASNGAAAPVRRRRRAASRPAGPPVLTD